MKKPYNEDWMRARVVHAAAEGWHRRGLLSAERLAAVKVRFPDGFFRANVWVKIALFLFTLLLNGCAGSLSGLLLAPVFDDSTLGAGLTGVAYGVGFFALLDVLIRERKLFHSGIDNALLYTATATLAGGLCLLASPVFVDETWGYGLLALPVLGYAVWRYASRLLTVGLLACLLFTVAALVVKIPVGRMLLPFLGMALAGGVYFIAQKRADDDAHFYWLDCLRVAQATALVVFYACGNVYAVTWGNFLLSGDGALPLSGIFYALTALVPVAYVVFGLKNRDRLLLVAGLLAVAASVLTFQVSALHLPWALLLTGSGAVLVATAWVLLRRLDPVRGGFTSVPEGRRAATAEALATTELPQVPGPAAAPDRLFGGGSFGGAGAGEGY